MKTLFTLLALLAAQSAFGQDDIEDAFDQGVLIIHASEHACYRIDVYFAENDEQHMRGLMYVRSLPETSGMLFIYPREEILSIWMKNTFIPLDILFVKADGTVSSIFHDAEPQSLRSMRALEPVQFVLELNAGVADKLSIDQYSRLEWERD